MASLPWNRRLPVDARNEAKRRTLGACFGRHEPYREPSERPGERI